MEAATYVHTVLIRIQAHTDSLNAPTVNQKSVAKATKLTPKQLAALTKTTI